jgi:bifunctional DNase/RNase
VRSVVAQRIRLHISDVVLAVPSSVGVEGGMVILTEDQPPGRSLRIIIGQPEARAIHVAWQGVSSTRPSTWDLFGSTINLLGGQFVRAVITSVEEERHYHASIELEQHGQHRLLACRPSDAIALAVRTYDAEIVAEASVLDEAGVLPDGSKPGPAAPDGIDTSPEALARREAELSAREAELAARERILAEREAALDRTLDRTDAPHAPGASGVTEPQRGQAGGAEA